MKSITAFGMLLAAVSAQQLNPKADFDKGRTRQQIGHIITPDGTAPLKQELIPRFDTYYPKNPTKRTKMRYGPYRLPPTSESTLMSIISGEAGTMTTIGTWAKPCADYCNLVLAQADLEYANGTVADNSNGAWLHHIVVLASGQDWKGVPRTDQVCSSLPAERFFSSGNERTPTGFGDVLTNKVISALPIMPSNNFLAQIELMNLENTEKFVYITVDYEYIPGKKPADVKVAKAMWFDITNGSSGCGISSAMPTQTKARFTRTSPNWTAKFSGELLGVGGHLHDGGVVLNVYQNNNVMCASKATYGTGGGHAHGRRRETLESIPMMDKPGASDGKSHIQEMSTCSLMGSVKSGDTFKIDASYEFGLHEGMKSKSGTYTEIMGIAIMYAAANEG